METIQTMQQELTRYFLAEKYESCIFVLVGILAIAVSIWLLVQQHTFKSMSYPLIAVGLIQIIVGGSVYLRSDTQIVTLAAQVQSAPQAYKADEIKRMDVVNKNFKTYKVIEIALLALGIGLIYAFPRHDTWYFLGVGLIIQSSFMLVFDLFAEHRAYAYLDCINKYIS
ncbi:MAG: hypothetical protein EAZ92_03130 [Candidatus Kapaibacterium sp.]|nr:MAG: hypothetical protein EAZ92_03130 [Candidatus Kapabacteria bacterium]